LGGDTKSKWGKKRTKTLGPPEKVTITLDSCRARALIKKKNNLSKSRDKNPKTHRNLRKDEKTELWVDGEESGACTMSIESEGA